MNKKFKNITLYETPETNEANTYLNKAYLHFTFTLLPTFILFITYLLVIILVKNIHPINYILFAILIILNITINSFTLKKVLEYKKIKRIAKHNDLIRHEERIRHKEKKRIENEEIKLQKPIKK